MEMEETRIVTGQWELSGFDFRIEADGMKLMMSGMKDGKFTGIKCHQCGTVYLPGPWDRHVLHRGDGRHPGQAHGRAPDRPDGAV
jgi:hypothetical protein